MADRDDLLARDLASGMRFANTMGEETRRAVDELALTVLALVEELKESGSVESAELARRLEAAQEAGLAFRTADQARTDFAIIEDELEAIMLA